MNFMRKEVVFKFQTSDILSTFIWLTPTNTSGYQNLLIKNSTRHEPHVYLRIYKIAYLKVRLQRHSVVSH